MEAQKRWEILNTKRQGPLTRARDAAKLTIPSLLPPEGHDENTILPQPYQSLGARGVNNLASKLLLALFPPNTPFFRLLMADKVIDQAEAQGAATNDIEEALRRIEGKVLKSMERSNLRPVFFVGLKHIIVTGNGCAYMPKDGKNRFFPMDRFVVLRDPSGTLVELIIKECVDPHTLPLEIRVACQCAATDMASAKTKTVDIYTHVQLINGKHVYYQEINRLTVPGSDGECPAEESPFIVMRWSAVANEDYGRGMVEEYIGDLRSMEGLNKSILAFAAAASKVLIQLKPNATTKEKDLKKDSGSVIIGNEGDVNVIQMEKFADFQVAKAVLDDLTLRLSNAFLLRSGTIRDAERVTAEEIRAQAQELEDVLGGVYTVQSQELQLPVVRREMFKLRESGDIRPLPKGTVEPSIVTGFDALGRGHELNRLREYINDSVQLLGPAALEYLNTEVGLKRLATGHNIDVHDLIRSAAEVQQARQAQQVATLAEKAAAPVAGNLTKQPQ